MFSFSFIVVTLSIYLLIYLTLELHGWPSPMLLHSDHNSLHNSLHLSLHSSHHYVQPIPRKTRWACMCIHVLSYNITPLYFFRSGWKSWLVTRHQIQPATKYSSTFLFSEVSSSNSTIHHTYDFIVAAQRCYSTILLWCCVYHLQTQSDVLLGLTIWKDTPKLDPQFITRDTTFMPGEQVRRFLL